MQLRDKVVCSWNFIKLTEALVLLQLSAFVSSVIK